MIGKRSSLEMLRFPLILCWMLVFASDHRKDRSKLSGALASLRGHCRAPNGWSVAGLEIISRSLAGKGWSPLKQNSSNKNTLSLHLFFILKTHKEQEFIKKKAPIIGAFFLWKNLPENASSKTKCTSVRINSTSSYYPVIAEFLQEYRSEK